MTRELKHQPLRFVLVVIVSFFLGILTLFYERIFYSSPSFGTVKDPETFFSQNPVFLLWAFVSIFQICFAASITIPLIIEILSLKRKFKISFATVAEASAIVVLLIVLSIVLLLTFGHTQLIEETEGNIIDHASFKLHTIICSGYWACFFAAVAILLLNSCVEEIADRSETDFLDFTSIKEKLQSYLNIFGVVITSSTVATFFLQKGIESFYQSKTNFPVEFVYTYALFNTFYISIIYFPVYMNIISTGKKLVEQKLLKDRKPDDDTQLLLTKRKALLDLMDTQSDYTGWLKKAIPILGPLISTLLSFMFK